MRLRTTAILASAAFGLAIPASGLAEVSTTIGTGAKTCVLGPGADCRGVVHRWTVEHHGNLRKAKFAKADLRGADFRGADLRGADFRGAKLRHAELRGANLKGAHFEAPKRVGKGANEKSVESYASCLPNCSGADLTGANLSSANLKRANLTGANLTNADLVAATFNYANLTDANLIGANLSYAFLDNANLFHANLTGAFLTYAEITYANLTDANLTNAFGLACADFTGATLSGATLPLSSSSESLSYDC